MGSDFAQVDFLDLCTKSGGIQNPVLGLGALTIRQSQEEIEEFAHNLGYRRLEEERSVRALFQDRYGIRDYHDCDVNGQAGIKLDLSHPVPTDLIGKFGTILNGGTLEHIFDIRQSMENTHLLVRPGGTFIHMVPLTWYDHGFFNLNPVLFHSLAEANRYTVLAEGYYVSAGSPPYGSTKPKVILTLGIEADVNRQRQVDVMLNSGSLPTNMMYLVALRKNQEAQFAVPYQVADGR